MSEETQNDDRVVSATPETPGTPVSDLAILAAAILAGPQATEEEVRAQLNRLVDFLAPASPLRGVSTKYDGARTFVATVTGVGKEAKSNRAVIYTTGQPAHRRPDGRESIRTARFDDFQFGAEAKQLANTAASLIGSRVVVRIANEMRGEQKYRRLISLEEIELDENYQEGKPPYQPKVESDLERLVTTRTVLRQEPGTTAA